MHQRRLASVFQFRFRTLLVAVASVALGITALVNAESAWAHSLFFAVLAILTLAVPLAFYRDGERRAFWAGFALFGWVYVILLSNIDERPRLEWNGVVARGPSANVPTSRLTYWVYSRAYGDPADTQVQVALDSSGSAMVWQESRPVRFMNSTATDSPGQPAAGARPAPQWWHFLNVAHALWTIVIACIGGITVRAIYILRPESGDK
jgi:hypothetical protein